MADASLGGGGGVKAPARPPHECRDVLVIGASKAQLESGALAAPAADLLGQIRPFVAKPQHQIEIAREQSRC